MNTDSLNSFPARIRVEQLRPSTQIAVELFDAAKVELDIAEEDVAGCGTAVLVGPGEARKSTRVEVFADQLKDLGG